MKDSPEQARRDRLLTSYDYDLKTPRQFFTTPFDQYKEHVGKPFTYVRRLPDAEPCEDGGTGEDMHLIRFGEVEIEAWGHECCQLIYDNCK